MGTAQHAEAFAREMRDLVEATAPRLFAVVEQFATRDGEPDGRVAAWGLAHQDGSAYVTSADGSMRMSLRTAERAAEWISLRPGSSGSLIWVGAGGVCTGD
ncbi:hypothetical protein [Streptomyces sp. H27-C3]|uniref:hypothetical protein n=1 Tax=Streptomyces sp. H27-C3 TaxID=3046305 RepID=UPI0024BB1893|nr:hypothetical protein [Streptomyces sp. H27-C3]MDJ0460465.1 hypothetical protein [Streptomyces sp. H27-C3]